MGLPNISDVRLVSTLKTIHVLDDITTIQAIEEVERTIFWIVILRIECISHTNISI